MAYLHLKIYGTAVDAWITKYESYQVNLQIISLEVRIKQKIFDQKRASNWHCLFDQNSFNMIDKTFMKPQPKMKVFFVERNRLVSQEQSFKLPYKYIHVPISFENEFKMNCFEQICQINLF